MGFIKNTRIILILFLLLNISLKAQDTLKQTVRGKILDKQTQLPIPGATVVLRNFEPVMAVISDIDGNYIIRDVPLGRINIECSYLGYSSQTLSNVILSSGREQVINFELEEHAFDLEEFVIKAYSRKDQPVNTMAIISARSFTLEETGRYAGSYGDPARMAANYAGVMTGKDNRNDIVIRGNSPMGILWRLDDIEIANPNHYAASGTTGGPITILNTNLLTTSDFLSGAFPAEFGNATSGVFDLKMRNGNNTKREHWLQTGWNGLEIGTEGPFSKKHQASYIIAYRYSILEILNSIGVNLGIDPRYQDLNLKVNLPYSKGKFSLIGLGGLSSIKIFDTDKKQKDWMFDESGEDVINSSALGMFALSNLHFMGEKTRLKTSFIISGSEVTSKIDTFSLQNRPVFLKAGEKSSETKYSITSSIMRKISSKSDFSSGFYYDIIDYIYKDSTFRNQQYENDTDAGGRMSLLRAYSQWHQKLTSKLLIVGGLHYQLFNLNNSWTLEPRIGIKWDINPVQSLNIGFGMHSQMQARMMYFAQTLQPDGSYNLSNINLDFTKCRHYVIGHDYLLSEFLRLKTEVYYQQLYNIPVKQSIGAYSMLNAGVEYFVGRQDSLINTGTGSNYGIEMTLEKFFNNNFYFLLTSSLFNSTYTAADNIERPTAFDTRYLINAVGGYEKTIGKKRNGVLVLGARFTWNGGRPYIPYDVGGTLNNGYETLDWNNAYTVRYPDYKRISIRFGFRRNKAKLSSELTLDLQYRTNYTNIYTERIDVRTGKIHNYQKMGLYPLSTWKINF